VVDHGVHEATVAPVAAGTTNPWTARRVLAYAHQGGAWEAPSSTLYAIRRALELGASGIELDVHATADGHLVVCHDGTVDRTTNGTGTIASMTLAELRALDNAYWFAPGADVSPGLADDAYRYRGRAPDDQDFTVATLTEVLDLMDDYPAVALNLDIKATAPAVDPYEERLAQALLQRTGTDRIIVASFLDLATEAFSRHAPDIATSAGTITTAGFWRAVHEGDEPPPMRHVALQVPARQGDLVVVDDAFVAAAHAMDVAVHVWTINDEAEMASLVDLGVDGVITDLPSTLLGVLAAKGAGTG
jgi:glycerophosphoryl diester phosphodiesterase